MIDDIEALVDELRRLPSEMEWLEFKKDNFDPEMIGADISALSNGAALRERRTAYLVWGIDNETHDVKGTERDFRRMKRGNELLENWLRRMLSQNADFEFVSGPVHGTTVGVLSVVPALGRPVTFAKEAFIRAGSSTKKLRDVPALEAALWDRLRSASFEARFARTGLTWTDALRLLDVSAYFDSLNLTPPSETDGIVHYLKEDGILVAGDDGRCSVSNLGALALGKSLSAFPAVARKALRLVQYDGKNRLSILRQWTEDRGYASVLRGLMDFVLALMHACIRHVQGERATNRSLRARFGLPDTSAGSVSRLFREAVSRGLLKPFDLEAGNRLSSYEPFWA